MGIKLNKKLSILSPIPIINKNGKCRTSTSSVEITATQNKEILIKVANIKQLSLKMLKKKNDWFFFICGEDQEESMIQCLKCKSWAHDLCAGVGKRTKKFVCDFCTEEI